MRKPSHAAAAAKQTVSLTINSDLYARAKRLRINASKIAEQALAAEVSRRMAEEAKAEIQRDLEASDAYAAKHGSFADLVNEHYQHDERSED